MAKNKEKKIDLSKEYELQIKSSRANAKRFAAYAQARSNLGNKKKKQKTGGLLE